MNLTIDYSASRPIEAQTLDATQRLGETRFLFFLFTSINYRPVSRSTESIDSSSTSGRELKSTSPNSKPPKKAMQRLSVSDSSVINESGRFFPTRIVSSFAGLITHFIIRVKIVMWLVWAFHSVPVYPSNGTCPIFSPFLLPSACLRHSQTEYVFGLVALLAEAFLFFFHLHGRTPVDVYVHMLLAGMIVLSILAGLCEMLRPHQPTWLLMRNLGILVQGTWFWQASCLLRYSMIVFDLEKSQSFFFPKSTTINFSDVAYIIKTKYCRDLVQCTNNLNNMPFIAKSIYLQWNH